jgi:hypothetical protein
MTAGTIDFGILAPRGNYGAVVDGDADAADLTLGYRTLNADFTQSTTRVSFWNAGYSDLPYALFADFNGGILEITMTPVGYDYVTLDSFLLGSYFGGPNRTATVLRVTDGGGKTLWSDEPYSYNGPAAAKINVGVKAPVLKLLVGVDWNLGVNNLAYTVSDKLDPTGVPEPSSFVLMGCGLALAVTRFRRAA